MRSLDVGGDEISHLLRVLAERPGVDDGVGGIGIHVRIRKEIPVNADGARFFCVDAAEVLGVRRAAHCAKGHRMGKNRGADKTHRYSALKVGGEEQRQFGVLLQTIRQIGGFIRLASQQERTVHVDGHGKRPDVVLLHGLAPLQVLGVFDVEKGGTAPDHENLADFFLERELVQSLLRPLLSIFGETRGTGVLILIGGECR